MELEAFERTPLRSEEGKRAYQDIIERGPLGAMFRRADLRLRPAKGGSRFAAYSDQSFFAHALNVATVAGVLYEAGCMHQEAAPDERGLRIALAAGAFHDFNKAYDRRPDLANVLWEKSDDLLALLGDYLDGDKAAAETVCHYALQTEKGTAWDARQFPTFLPGLRGTLLAHALGAADALSGHHVDPDDPRTYDAEVRKRLRESPLLPPIRVLALTRMPQSALAYEARNVLFDWIAKDGWLLHESETFVSWVGPPLTPEVARALAPKLANRTAGELKDAFDKSPPSHISLRIEWTTQYAPDAAVVKAWIDHFGGRLVFWSGNWGVRHRQKLQADFGAAIVYEPSKTRVRVEVPREDDPVAGSEHHAARLRTQWLIAHTIHERLKPRVALPSQPPEGYDLHGVTGSLNATVAGIFAARGKAPTPEAYDALCGQIASLLAGARRATQDPTEAFFLRYVGVETGALAHARTGKACIYCGVAATTKVSEAAVFGIKPTTWAPRKKGVQSESAGGVICDLCVLENQVRHRMSLKSGVSPREKEFVSLHLHVADLAVASDWHAFAKLVESSRVKGRRLLIIPKGGLPEGAEESEALAGIGAPLRGHLSLRIPKPKGTPSASETLVHLWRLRDFLEVIHLTGFKMHVSPLFLSPQAKREQFAWENAPAWMAALMRRVRRGDASGEHVASLRIDHIERARACVEALLQTGNLVGGSQGHRTLVSQVLVQPLALYLYPDNRPSRSIPSQTNTDVLGEIFVTRETTNAIRKIADPYVRFNRKEQHWANSHWTWATRDYLDLRERFQGKPDEERHSMVVGTFLQNVTRRNPFLRDDDAMRLVEDFAAAIEAYVRDLCRGKHPTNLDRRGLIAGVAYWCQKDYRTIHPKKDDAAKDGPTTTLTPQEAPPA
jgi:hypothetical protein